MQYRCKRCNKTVKVRAELRCVRCDVAQSVEEGRPLLFAAPPEDKDVLTFEYGEQYKGEGGDFGGGGATASWDTPSSSSSSSDSSSSSSDSSSSGGSSSDF